MAVAFIGAVLGGIVGFMLQTDFSAASKWTVLRNFPEGSVLFAAACGVAAQAFYLDRIAATKGFGSGL